MKKSIIGIIAIALIAAMMTVPAMAQPPAEEWNVTFGGAGYDKGYSAQQTTDGGYIVVGTTKSFGAGNYDVWLIKTASDGTEQWNKTFGGAGYDGAYYPATVRQTTDGGYIIATVTKSFGAGGYDIWLIKTTADGTEQWSKTFGGTGSEFIYSSQCVELTTDGGYIISGYTKPSGADNYDV